MKSRVKIITVLIIISIILLNINYVISLIAMGVVNKISYNKSVLKSENIKIELLGGLQTKDKDWYPFVNCFNADYFNHYVKENVKLTILYNFGYFNKNSSVIFDPNSNYYSSFYGCYIVKGENNLYYGFDDESNIDIEKIVKIPEYDYKYLVANSLGCPQNRLIMDYKIENIVNDISLAGISNFIKIDTEISMNGLNHQYKNFRINYIQYGTPINSNNEDFKIIKMYGRLYINKLKNDVTIIYYVFSPSKRTIENCDKEIIQKSKIKIINE